MSGDFGTQPVTTVSSNRWQLPMLDDVASPEPSEPARSEADVLASQLFTTERELSQLNGSIAERREAAAAQGRAEGYDDGLAAGRAAAEETLARQLAENARQWSELVAGLQTRLASLDQALDESIHDLVVQLGATVLRAELAISGVPLRRMIEEALNGLREDAQHATLLMHPDDLKLLGDPGLPARADATISRGELRIQTLSGDIEASLHTRIEHALLQLQRELS